jgi:hypothetical protein
MRIVRHTSPASFLQPRTPVFIYLAETSRVCRFIPVETAQLFVCLQFTAFMEIPPLDFQWNL